MPDRYAHDPEHPITRAKWETLGIPVGAVFLLRGKDGVAAFYPSPAGAPACLLDLAAVDDLTAAHPLLAAAQPEAEAILVRTEGRTSENGPVEAFLVPIDVCYELVGTVRMYWQGSDGDAEARAGIDAFFDRVRAAARPIVAG